MSNKNNRNVKSHRSEAGHRGVVRLLIGVVLALLAILVFVFARSLSRGALERDIPLSFSV